MKKILYVLPVVALLAAGCGSSDQPDQKNNQTSNNQNQTGNNQNSPTPTPSTTPTEAMISGNSAGWQGTLMASDNSAKGKYKITTDSHTIYIKTSRDYSQLVGKNVTVKYNGTMDSFSLTDIVAQ